MKGKNLTTNISYRNDERDFKIYAYIQSKRDKSSFIKDLIEKEMLKEKKVQN